MCTSVFYAKVRVLRRDWLICEITRAAHGYNKRVQRGKRKRKLVIWNLKTKKISRTHFSSIYEQLQNLHLKKDLLPKVCRDTRLASVCIFSMQFSTHFLWHWQGEFVEQSRASLNGDNILYSRDLNVWFGGERRRN